MENIEQHPAIGKQVQWTSNGVTKVGTIVEAMKKPKKDDKMQWNDILEEKIRKYNKTHSIQFTKWGFRGAPVSFLVEVKGEKENHKPRLLHPYPHKLQPLD
jgi:hypothetical protein